MEVAMRENTRVIRIGDKKIGGGNPVAIQSMTNTKTDDIKNTVAQIQELARAGCDIIRCAVPDMEAAKALKENGDYGLSMADTTCFRIQETLKTIYDWFCGNTNDAITDKGAGLSGKFGIIRANMAYTSDYSSRLVLTAPELKAETVDDLMVNFDRSAIPLAAAAADFYPFMLFHMRKFFENLLLNNTSVNLLINKIKSDLPVQSDWIQYFNDDVLKDQLKKFVYSHDNRFLPIEIPNGKDFIYIKNV